MTTISSNEIGNPYHDAKGLFTSGPGGSEGNSNDTLTEREFNQLDPDYKSIKDDKRRRYISQATEAWLGAQYEDINGDLRKEVEDWYYGPNQNYIRGLDRGFETLGKQLPRDVTLYRGISGLNNDSIADKFQVGTVVKDKGFQSVTHDKHVAEMFGKDQHGVTLHINAKKGTTVFKPMQDAKHAEDPDMLTVEPEILLRRGSSYRVTKRSGKNVYVDLL